MERLRLNIRRLQRKSRRWLTGLSIGLCALMLTACASQTVPSDRMPLPASLLTPCGDLDPLADGSAQEVLKKLVEVSQEYYDCREKHSALVRAVEGVK